MGTGLQLGISTSGTLANCRANIDSDFTLCNQKTNSRILKVFNHEENNEHLRYLNRLKHYKMCRCLKTPADTTLMYIIYMLYALVRK